VLNIYRRIEDWHDTPDPTYHGTRGPVFVQPAPDSNLIAPAMLEGACSVGIPTFENQNGRMMEGEGGCSILDVRLRSGRRQSVFRSYTVTVHVGEAKPLVPRNPQCSCHGAMSAPPLPPSIWEQTPPTAQEMLWRQAAELAHLRAEVAQLKATVDEWARRLGRTSRNSSPPPSADPPPARSPRARHEPRGRRPGGQPGHAGQARALVPVEAVDVVIPLRPVRGAHCQHLLLGEDPAPERHPVTEIPSMRPVITAYQGHRVVCSGCG
jgi:Family of unknown function (DUF6444)/GMC oxidoreductase